MDFVLLSLCHPVVFILNFEHISHFFSSVSTADFEHANTGWEFGILAQTKADKLFEYVWPFSVVGA